MCNAGARDAQQKLPKVLSCQKIPRTSFDAQRGGVDYCNAGAADEQEYKKKGAVSFRQQVESRAKEQVKIEFV
jgi:hypothetical protein